MFLLKFITENQDKNYRFGAGYTDLILELKKQPDDDLVVVNLANLKDDFLMILLKQEWTVMD